MANTLDLIASSTVGIGGAASIDFTSIPSTYTDLVLKLSVRDASAISSQAGNQFSLKVNNSSANITEKQLIAFQAGGIASYSNTQMYTPLNGASDTASTFSSAEFYFTNYTASANKSASIDGVAEGNTANLTGAAINAALWSQTAAINQLTVIPVGTFTQYSTAYLYGVKNA